MKTVGMAIGIVMIIVGAILGIAGMSLMNQPSPNINDPNWSQKSDAQFQQFGQGAAMAVGGFGLIGFGVMIIYVTNIRRVATYMAVETAPAVNIMTRSAGSGLAEGINESGGIHVDGGGGKSSEVVKVKCRNCGYLDTEDADYCSKCGKKL